MELVARLIIVAVLLIVVQELFRRANMFAALGVFLILPMALAVYWFRMGQAGAYGNTGVFPWVKLVSLQVGACWLTALRFTFLGRYQWALGLSFVMLPLNMLEAVTQDAFGGHLAHYLLVLTGALLIFSVPHPMRAIRVDPTDRYREIRYTGMTRVWIAGYTLWNGTFVYLNYPTVAGHQMAVLASSLLIGLIKPSRWLQARTFTLATDLLMFATFPGVLVPLTDTSHWASPDREDYAAAVCLASTVAYAAWFFARRKGRSIEQVADD